MICLYCFLRQEILQTPGSDIHRVVFLSHDETPVMTPFLAFHSAALAATLKGNRRAMVCRHQALCLQCTCTREMAGAKVLEIGPVHGSSPHLTYFEFTFLGRKVSKLFSECTRISLSLDCRITFCLKLYIKVLVNGLVST